MTLAPQLAHSVRNHAPRELTPDHAHCLQCLPFSSCSGGRLCFGGGVLWQHDDDLALKASWLLSVFITNVSKVEHTFVRQTTPDAPTAPGVTCFAFTSQGEWWRLLTASFCHTSLMHLLLNMLAIHWLGPPVEYVSGCDHFKGNMCWLVGQTTHQWPGV